MDTYKIYYDYTYVSMSFHWLIGLLFMGLGFGFSVFPLKTQRINLNGSNPKVPNKIAYTSRIPGILLLIFGAFFTYTIGRAQIFGQLEVNRIIKEKAFNTIEGEVRNFHPMPKGGHDLEHFTINGIYFEYSDFEPIEGFNKTSSHDGPIKRNGQIARIKYYTKNGRYYIIRLEIKEPTLSNSK